MPSSLVNGIQLFWEMRGSVGSPVVLVHGSWGDHHNWDSILAGLGRSFRTITFDRRGHSQSERPEHQGHIAEDVDDLALLLEKLGLGPAHLVGNSYGAAIVLKLAASRPRLFASMTVHEPPLLGMIADHPALPEVKRRIAAVLERLAQGKDEEGAELFVETVGLGPGMWARLPPEMRRTFVRNAPTFLEEQREPDSVMVVDPASLTRFDRPALITLGDQSPPFFAPIVERVASALPHARRHTFHGAGHVPHVTHPREYLEVVGSFLEDVDEQRVRAPGESRRLREAPPEA